MTTGHKSINSINIKIPKATPEDFKRFYYEILYIYENWKPEMRKALGGVTRKHVLSVLKKYEKYK